MKKNEFIQIKGLDVKELKDKAKTLRYEIGKLTMDKNMKKLKDLKSVSKKKKDLARILTILSQKKLLEQLSDEQSPLLGKSKSVTDKQKTDKPDSENQKQKTDNRKTGGKK